MKRNTPCKFVELLHSPYAPGWQFFELPLQPFPKKQVNMRTTESSCSGFDVISGPGPIPRYNLGPETKWQHFDVL